MKRMAHISFMLFLIMGYAAQAQPAIQNSSDAWENIVAEAIKGGYHLITPEELKEKYVTDPTSFSLVDVRQEWSYQMQHIRGALHIDFAPTWWNQYSPMMRSEMKKLLGPDKDKTFVFY